MCTPSKYPLYLFTAQHNCVKKDLAVLYYVNNLTNRKGNKWKEKYYKTNIIFI